jgi:hypothetical protein
LTHKNKTGIIEKLLRNKGGLQQMNYTHYDLGGLSKGRTVEVILQGNAANVYLMDHENMVKYAKAKPFKALGGLMTFSPIRLQTISTAHWHIVIDMPRGTGAVKTTYRVLNSQPPNISTTMTTFKPSEEQKSAVCAAAASKSSTISPPKPAETPVAAPPPKPPAKPEQVPCPKCGILTIRGKFCTECGAPMEKVCPGCAVVNTLSCKFCHECGYNLV